ncbi:hypothetical protein J1N35_011726 [Gossypium stocksii]|uniref:Retrovirus-related Pol polyprotein from transposon TNT 1-94-like beta-barrel domain-containing protein n=1 Tax=Gossypium stocksii TaxID=47602 RepID=A0A9D3W4R5_9ROSI|nr:hypothetical protein J1N35_011726 [Gossypium stocksii]
MCPNNDLFSICSPVEDGVVLMRNNSPCKVTGVGTVQIRMHDEIIRTQLDVKHVSDLKKNSFLLVLDSKDCRITIDSSGIEVFYGALVLIRG